MQNLKEGVFEKSKKRKTIRKSEKKKITQGGAKILLRSLLTLSY